LPLAGDLLATLILDPLPDLPGVPHPSVFGRLAERLGKVPLLAAIEQGPAFSTRVSVPTVTQNLGTARVVTSGQLLDQAPRVSGYLHDFTSHLAFADQPEDLVVATQDRIIGLTVAVLQL